MIRSLFGTFLIFTICLTSSSQEIDFSTIDTQVANYAKTSIASVEELAQKINADFKLDIEKARAIYAWLGQNVRYDVPAYLRGNNGFSFKYKNEADRLRQLKQRQINIANTTFSTRKAVCDGYANLFLTLCELTGIECVLINGYSKNNPAQIGRQPSGIDHAWNALKIDGEWILADATWGAGFVNGRTFNARYTGGYFDTPPDKFHLNHFPEDPKWALSDATLSQFVEAPVLYANYMELDLRVVSPLSGILQLKKNKGTVLRVKSDTIPQGISFAYGYQKYASDLVFKPEGRFYEAEIAGPEKKAEVLNLFYNLNGLATYVLR